MVEKENNEGDETQLGSQEEKDKGTEGDVIDWFEDYAVSEDEELN